MPLIADSVNFVIDFSMRAMPFGLLGDELVPAVVDDARHILYTLSAVQIAATYDALAELDSEAIVKYVCGLQGPAQARSSRRVN